MSVPFPIVGNAVVFGSRVVPVKNWWPPPPLCTPAFLYRHATTHRGPTEQSRVPRCTSLFRVARWCATASVLLQRCAVAGAFIRRRRLAFPLWMFCKVGSTAASYCKSWGPRIRIRRIADNEAHVSERVASASGVEKTIEIAYSFAVSPRNAGTTTL